MPEAPESARLEVPRRKKTVFFLTWLVALAGTGGFHPLTAIFLPLFPAGLAILLPGTLDDAGKIGVIVVGWVLYLLHAWMTLRTKSGAAYWTLYVVLLVVLAVNMHGCQPDLKNLAHIH